MAEILTKQRQVLRSLDRSLDNFKKIGKGNLSAARVRNRISALKDCWAEIQAGHLELVTRLTKQEQAACSYFSENLYDHAEDTYHATSDFMAECLEELEPPVSPNQSIINSSVHHGYTSSVALQHLPPIKLPPFDGKFEEWESFRDRFTALIIDNHDLTNFTRMHYLTSSLRGHALDCVKCLAVTENNFTVAWNLLKSRYGSARRLLNVHLSTLLNLSSVTRESVSDLQSLRDRVGVAVAALKNLKRSPEQLWNDMLVCIVSQRLDPVTRKAWNLKFCTEDLPSFEDLKTFLDTRIRALEDLKLPAVNADKATKASSAKINSANATTALHAPCSLCNANHNLQSCSTFINKNPSERREIVKAENRCTNCLSKRHNYYACTSKFTCRHCKRKHHSMLHESSDSSSKSAESAAQQQPASSAETAVSEVKSLFVSTKKQTRSTILLATAWLNVAAPSGRTICVRALLDQGSEMTFITERLAQQLKLKRIRMPISISAIGGVSAGTHRHTAQILISPRNALTPVFSTTALILKTLTAYSPPRAAQNSVSIPFKNLTLADDNPFSSHPIDILIGADLYGETLLDGIQKSTSGEPVAQNTAFGWIISGPIVLSNSPMNTSSVNTTCQKALKVNANHCCNSDSLEYELRKFWEIEEMPHKKILSPEDERCETHFRNTHSRDSTGRYVVRLPFKHGPPIDIGDSRAIAEKSLRNLIRRLDAHPAQAREYSDFLSEYELLGHMQVAPKSFSHKGQCIYIPHHSVIRDSSTTTRLRVVFDASRATSNGSSLNDHLLAGPKLQSELPAVIMQWRQFKYVFTADITKMYRQIRVDPRDMDYQRILWQSASAHVTEFQLLTVTYGTACAPFLALRVLKQLVQDEGQKFPLAVPVLTNQTYVDDVLFGEHDVTRIRQVREQLIRLLRCGGFELRKWASNSQDLLAEINPEDHGLACTKPLDESETLKVLGVGWNPVLDVFQFQSTLKDHPPDTKRSILAIIAKIFDPLGWVTPATIIAKVFMQTLWRLKLEWDQKIPPSQLTTWHQIHSNLRLLNEFRVPRWTGCGPHVVKQELHGFADASLVAYAAVVYLKVTSSDGNSTISLIAGKSRVAPLKPLSIPRLELSAAVLLSRLMKFVQESISANTTQCYCWTDSTILLAWIRQHPSRWKTFVANRVTEILANLPHLTWRHVSTDDNPADCASRGLLAQDLINHHLWWSGPPWLKRSSEFWPIENSTVSHETELEVRTTCATVAMNDREWDLAKKYSSWPKLIRVTAYIYKFLNKCKRRKHDQPQGSEVPAAVSADEYRSAKLYWIRYIQQALFSTEIQALTHKRSLNHKSPILSFNPFIDQDNVLRVGGRLQNSPLPFNRKHPILLASHPLVHLIIKNAHVRSLHAGLQLTLNVLRQEFWILRSRSMTKAIIHRCVPCAREKAAVPSQLMGNLPAIRVTKPERSFLHCGVDYAGPIQIRTSSGRGIKTQKAYIALFICLNSRAIHLELVSNYSTDAFLDAYLRFCSRRGLPESMYSDNGTTFLGADRELASAYRAALTESNFQNKSATDSVSWNFIPPSAPHFGGLWEAGVKSVKHHLRRLVKNETLTFEEFTTLLCRIEACLNSRPIAPLSDHLDDYEPLTPGHFLIGSAITTTPEPSLLNLKERYPEDVLSSQKRLRDILWTSFGYIVLSG
nr:PREDICTED: uncharacterized protein LOC105670437 [Linepithema humile]